MRTRLFQPSGTSFDRFTGLLLRVVSLVGVVGGLVVLLHSLSGERGKAAPAAAIAGTKLEERTREERPATVPSPAAPRVVYAGPSVPPNAAASAPRPAAAPAPPLGSASPTVSAPPPAPVAAAALTPVPVSPPPPAPAPIQVAGLEEKPAAPRSAAGRLVDLNTATADELNRLNGAGMIGRAVIRARPYASPEDLLRKKVLNRTTYNRIKDQITVQ